MSGSTTVGLRPGLVSVIRVSLRMSMNRHLGSDLSNQNILEPQQASSTGVLGSLLISISVGYQIGLGGSREIPPQGWKKLGVDLEWFWAYSKRKRLAGLWYGYLLRCVPN